MRKLLRTETPRTRVLWRAPPVDGSARHPAVEMAGIRRCFAWGRRLIARRLSVTEREPSDGQRRRLRQATPAAAPLYSRTRHPQVRMPPPRVHRPDFILGVDLF